MVTTFQVPVEEYLTHTYEPDAEYDDGVLIGRNVGQERHSRSQLLIGSHLFTNEKEWGIRAFVEQRIKIAPRKFCVADLCATLATTPREAILSIPPLFTIEILSPDDDFKDVQIKAGKYLSLGVPYVWTVDPDTADCWRHDERHSMTIVEGSVLRVDGTPITIPVAELIAQI